MVPSEATEIPEPTITPPRELVVAGVRVCVALTETLIVSPLTAAIEIPAPLLVVT